MGKTVGAGLWPALFFNTGQAGRSAPTFSRLI